MKRRFPELPERYRAALRLYLQQGRHASLVSAHGLGSQAMSVGLKTLDLAKLHERILIDEVLPERSSADRAGLMRQAGAFFAAAITPLETTQGGAREAADHHQRFVAALSQRTVEVVAANLELKLEIARRQAIEVALTKSEQHYAQLLRRSDRLQTQLRRLSRQLLSAQEDERRKISRELHDVIAQTLTGINLRLAALKTQANHGPSGLEQDIIHTQELARKAVDIVHRFARELRPAVLDDFGLIPALHSSMKAFTTRTGVRTRLTAYAGVEDLHMDRRTVLFRVVQEALTNVDRHAKASTVTVTIKEVAGASCCMKIEDDGRSFNVERILHARGGRRLGLLGMRERVEMIGGSFTVTSAPGKGTTLMAEIPLGRLRRSRAARAAKAVCG